MGPGRLKARPQQHTRRASRFKIFLLREGTVVVVDSRFGRDLASAHPMDAALRRILDEHLALRVDLPA